MIFREQSLTPFQCLVGSWPSGALLSTKAQKIARDSGALIYWKGAEESDKQIYANFKAMEVIFKRRGDL